MKTFLLSVILMLSVLVSCNTKAVVEPVQLTGRSARLAPSNLAGWWKFQSYTHDSYPYPTTQNYSDYRPGCTLSNRWLYISPSNGFAYTYDGDKCYPGSLAWVNSATYSYLVEYFVWGTFAGETMTYYSESTTANTGQFALYRGETSNTVVYTQYNVFNSGNNLQLAITNAGEAYYYRRATSNESTPSLP